MATSCRPLSLSDTARFTTSSYLELYNRVAGNTLILGLGTEGPLASLQYSQDCRYYFEDLTTAGVTGLVGPTGNPAIHLTGLSRNLQLCD